MKTLLSLLISILLVGCNAIKVNHLTELYPIYKDNKWGYINEFGEEVIPPQYFSAGIDSYGEGLLPVRIEGRYGFVDKSGVLRIKAKYDYAQSFKKGVAKVYVGPKPYLIDSIGNILFEHDYREIGDLTSQKTAVVRSQTGKHGLINYRGELLVDTVFHEIGYFEYGLAVIQQLDTLMSSETEVGLINEEGDFIVELGVYHEILDFDDEYIEVALKTEEEIKWARKAGMINRQGDYLFTIPKRKWDLDYRDDIFTNNHAVINIYFSDPVGRTVWSRSERYTYQGMINDNGEIVCSDESWDLITPPHFGWFFTKDTNKSWKAFDLNGVEMDTEFEIVDVLFDDYGINEGSYFEGGYEVVQTIEGVGIIDSTRQFRLSKHSDELVHKDFGSLRRIGDLVFYYEDGFDEELDEYYTNYGFWNIKTDVYTPTIIRNVQFNSESRNLIAGEIDRKEVYIDKRNGNVVWESDKQKSIWSYNIDYMNRGYFYALSRPIIAEELGLGGYGRSENNYKEIDFDSKGRDSLSIIVYPEKEEVYGGNYEGIALEVANYSTDTVFFDAQDSRLYLLIQALDQDGNWKDIEYLPSSWCGNSYHTLNLRPNYYWHFAIPNYDGEFRTKLRAKLMRFTLDKESKELILVSEEFEGAVNPGQFWRKTGYISGGLMDPYNE